MAKKDSNKRRIFMRYGMITAGFVAMALGIVWYMFRTTVVEAAAWNERAEKQLSRIDTIAPERGSILASNGNILACNVRVCDIKIDMRHNKIKAMPKSKLKEKLDSLADTLDMRYPRFDPLKADAKTRAEKSWRVRLYEELEKDPDRRTRSLTIARNRPLEEYDSARKFVLIRDFKGAGFRCPLYKEEHSRRIYPYGKMANRSIGRVHEVVTEKTRHKGEIHGYSGLEKDLDSLLYGKPGYAKQVPLTKGYGNWVTTPPTPGYDLLTTIDIDLQDIVEESLQDICSETNCEWGTAILMEVETGEIVALSSIERMDDGSYGEALNRAVLPYEPGSVIKPISMMIAFEDGLVSSVNQTVDCSPFQRTKDPHAPTVKNMKQVIEMSSNTGIARVIFKGYAADPAKYYDRLASIGFFDRINSGIAGEQVPPGKAPGGSEQQGTADHHDFTPPRPGAPGLRLQHNGATIVYAGVLQRHSQPRTPRQATPRACAALREGRLHNPHQLYPRPDMLPPDGRKGEAVHPRSGMGRTRHGTTRARRQGEDRRQDRNGVSRREGTVQPSQATPRFRRFLPLRGA